MQIDEAINSLKKIKANNEKKKSEITSNDLAKGLDSFKNIIIGAMSDLTDVQMKNKQNVNVTNFPKNFGNSNPPEKSGNKEMIVVNNPNFTLSTQGLEQKNAELIKKVSDVLSLLENNKSSSSVGEENNFSRLGELLKAIKDIKVNPIVNVKSPDVNVPAPVVNVPKIDFPKSIEVSNIDFGGMVNQLEEIVTELKYNQTKGVRVTNPGDFPVSPSVAAFKDINGKVTQAVLDANGYLRVSIQQADSNLEGYQPADSDESSSTKYYGFVNKDGEWYIFRDTGTTYRYFKGDSNYPTNWTARVGLAYDYYNTIF